MRANKRSRQSELQSLLDGNPFLTDQELADKFTVSIQTIRLDRMELGIPELRERVKMVANDAYAKAKSLGDEKLMGNLLEFDPGVRGVSALNATMDMIYERTMTVKAEHIFAQANSLAILVADSMDIAVMEFSGRFLRSIYAGERLICTVTAQKAGNDSLSLAVSTRSNNTEILAGTFNFIPGNRQGG